MDVLAYIADFFAGLFLCNCIPHLCAGLRGESFPTPFAKPSGIGLSSAFTNFFWGTANLIVGWSLTCFSPIAAVFSLKALIFFAGFCLLGARLSRRFAFARKQRNKV